MHPTPLIEPDRFFAGPRNRKAKAGDAQTDAVARLVARCELLRPHLRTVDALEAYVARQPDPARLRRRIALALALERPDADFAPLGGRAELEAFRSLALHRTAAVIWVFA